LIKRIDRGVAVASVERPEDLVGLDAIATV
jgi:hypothetical protein